MIAVVCHDAGGAEIVSSWLKTQQEPYCLSLEGPAIGIFSRKLGAQENLPLANALAQADWLLCGTSWQSDLERRALTAARTQNIHSVAFLEHWVNYVERFQTGQDTVLPDEIWVGDVYAETLAHTLFPTTQIVYKKNPYLAELTGELSALQSRLGPPVPHSLLYLCEPIKEHAELMFNNPRHWGYTEEDAVTFFFQHLSAIDPQASQLTFRPHPSEAAEKYHWAQTLSPLPTTLNKTEPLLEAIVRTETVVGCESMALVVALLAQKRVISCIPPGGKACSLPHDNIEHLQDLCHYL